MGHERVGNVPRSERWQSIVGDLSEFGANPPDEVADIARRTLSNVRTRYQVIYRDEGVQAAFTFLLALATDTVSRETASPPPTVNLDDDPSTARIAASLNSWISANKQNLEYAEIARRAGGDALARWTRTRREQPGLFGGPPNARAVWHAASNASGFCTVARIFFASFTDRYLRYFLDREASGVIPSVSSRDLFSQTLQTHVDSISRHAYETAAITQSFAAGWFNKHALTTFPSDDQVAGFLRTSFGKIQEELLREGDT